MASKNFILELFHKQWNRVPEWRFMQLISNFQSYMGSDCFYMTDKEFIEKLAAYINDLVKEGRE